MTTITLHCLKHTSINKESLDSQCVLWLNQWADSDCWYPVEDSRFSKLGCGHCKGRLKEFNKSSIYVNVSEFTDVRTGCAKGTVGLN